MNFKESLKSSSSNGMDDMKSSFTEFIKNSNSFVAVYVGSQQFLDFIEFQNTLNVTKSYTTLNWIAISILFHTNNQQIL